MFTNLLDGLSVLLIVCGVGFFLAGTLGLLRFPDAYTRLHALTKADNVGLGLITLGLMWQVEALAEGLLLLLIWGLVVLAGASNGQLLATAARDSRVTATKPGPGE